MEPINPRVNWALEGQKWRWPASKFDLRCEEMFTTLHRQHNTVEIPLQDFYGFYHDVRELADKASTREELDRLLTERKEKRTDELLKAFRTASFETLGRPSCFKDTITWTRCVTMFRTRSLAAFVMFFAGFFPNSDYGEEAQRSRDPHDGPPRPLYSPESSQEKKDAEGQESRPTALNTTPPEKQTQVYQLFKLGSSALSSQETKTAEREEVQSPNPRISPSLENTRADRPSKPQRTNADASITHQPEAEHLGAVPNPPDASATKRNMANTPKRSTRKRKCDDDSARLDSSPPLKYRLRKRGSPT